MSEKLNIVQLVVFDMAGTTVTDNHEVESCFARSAKETGLFLTKEQVLAVQGWSKRYVFEYFWAEQLGKDHPELEQHIDYSYTHFRQVLESYYLNPDHIITPTLGCIEFLSFLRSKGIYAALTTGFYREVANIILNKIGWLHQLNEHHINMSADALINISVTSDEVVQGRPAPYMIERAMEKLGITDPKRVINIGDTPSDLESGVRAGVLASLGLVNGTHSQQQLMAYRNDGLFQSLAHLHQVWYGKTEWPKPANATNQELVELLS